MRDQINLLSENDYLFKESTGFTLNPLGSYYIVDKASKKILYYNNYGKLNYIIYHPDYRFDSDKENPKYLDKKWTFGKISQIAANLDKLYVVSSNPSSLQSNGAAKDGSPNNPQNDQYTKKAQMILVFDNRGEFLYQIGRKGIDSEPFLFYIVKLFIDSQDQLFAITRQAESYEVYRFSREGRIISRFALSKTLLSDKSFQSNEKGNKKGFWEISSPQLSYNGKYLFFELYHYIREINQTTSKTESVITNGYYIYSINTENPKNSLKKNFTVWEYHLDDQEKRSRQIYGEQFIGTTENGLLVLLQNQYTEETNLIYYKPDGTKEYIVNIILPNKDPYQLYLAANGLLSSLYFYKDRIALKWWRTDMLINKELSF